MNLSKSKMDILDEIEKIFGKPTKMTLFADEENAYNMFRQSIIDAPFCTYDKAKLPFADIRGTHVQSKTKESIHAVDEIAKHLFDKVINPLLSYAKQKSGDVKVISNRHIFKLEKAGVCKACGYYDFFANHFYIMKGSVFVKTFGKSYSALNSGATRKRMIEKSCTDMGKYYIVDNDFKCRTATSAASVLMGKVSHYSYWVDDKGKCLADIFPTRFTIKNTSK